MMSSEFPQQGSHHLVLGVTEHNASVGSLFCLEQIWFGTDNNISADTVN